MKQSSGGLAFFGEKIHCNVIVPAECRLSMGKLLAENKTNIVLSSAKNGYTSNELTAG